MLGGCEHDFFQIARPGRVGCGGVGVWGCGGVGVWGCFAEAVPVVLCTGSILQVATVRYGCRILLVDLVIHSTVHVHLDNN
jgi:hypothetical protein